MFDPNCPQSTLTKRRYSMDGNQWPFGVSSLGLIPKSVAGNSYTHYQKRIFIEFVILRYTDSSILNLLLTHTFSFCPFNHLYQFITSLKCKNCLQCACLQITFLNHNIKLFPCAQIFKISYNFLHFQAICQIL